MPPRLEVQTVLTIDDANATILSPCRMLQNIMESLEPPSETAVTETKKPCDVFDLIVGSGMGGAMAVLLGSPFNLSTKEVERCLHKIVDILFFQLDLDPQKRAVRLETYFKKLALKYLGDAEAEFWAPGTAVKNKIIVLANQTKFENQTPAVFYNWPAKRNPSAKVWEILRAATAYYGVVKLPIFASNRTEYASTDIANANPVKWVHEYLSLERLPKLILSLGGGYPKVIHLPPEHISDLTGTMEALCRDCESAHQIASQRYHGLSVEYFRFNVAQGMQILDFSKGSDHFQSQIIGYTNGHYSREETLEDEDNLCTAILRPYADATFTMPFLGRPNQSPDSGSDSDNSGLKILSLDGGGLFVISELLILREVMKELLPDQQVAQYPYRFFDLIGGSGFGGIIAILLGRLHLSIDGAIQAFQDMNVGLWPSEAPEDLAARSLAFEERVDDVIEDSTGMRRPLFQDDRCCRTAVSASYSANMNGKRGPLLCTYQRRGRSDTPLHLTVREAIRAASAYRPVAPDVILSLGPMLKIRYTGADLIAPNPTEVLMAEAKQLWENRPIDLLLSIGAGKPGQFSLPEINSADGLEAEDANKISDTLEKLCLDAERTHQDVLRVFKSPTAGSNPYYRFNIEQGLQFKSHWSQATVEDLASHFLGYIDDTDTRKLLSRLRTYWVVLTQAEQLSMEVSLR